MTAPTPISKAIEDVFSIGLNRAVTVIAEKNRQGSRAWRSGTPAALKELGDHPDDGGPITVRDGRYGPYVNYGKINATLPKGKDPMTVTLEEALALIAPSERRRQGKPKPASARPAAKKAPRKPPAKKAAARPPQAARQEGAAKPAEGKAEGKRDLATPTAKPPKPSGTRPHGTVRKRRNRTPKLRDIDGEAAPPTRDRGILRFIAKPPERSGKREIAKAFGLKGAARIGLKELLRDLEAEGLLIASARKR